MTTRLVSVCLAAAVAMLGAYELLLDNFGSGVAGRNGAETATVQIVESTGTCPAS